MIVQFLSLGLILFFMTAILLHPTVCAAGAASGLLIWFESALPSLFPFMVLTGLIIRMNVLETLTHALARIRWFRHGQLPFLFAAAVGLLCGYPMGIRTVSELRESGLLSSKQASLLISFVNQPGPMFVLGYALPFCALTGEMSRRFVLAFYGGVILTAAICGIISWITRSFIQKKKHTETVNLTKKVTSAPPQNGSFFQLFEDTVLNAMVTLTKIGGYMMLFSLIFALMENTLPLSPNLLLIFGGLLEMTSGIAKAAAHGGTHVPYLILGFLSFGGLCVTAQSFSLGKLETHEQLHYLFWKSLQTAFTIFLFYLLNSYCPV